MATTEQIRIIKSIPRTAYFTNSKNFEELISSSANDKIIEQTLRITRQNLIDMFANQNMDLMNEWISKCTEEAETMDKREWMIKWVIKCNHPNMK